ncbi:M60 family metallopeptidase [Pseudomonas sp. 3A(2025)]
MGNLYAVIGVPELDTPTSFALALGQNIVTAPHAGLLSFINRSPSGHIDMVVDPVNARVPTFELGLNDNADWARQMAEHSSAPVVLLMSTRALVVVRYRSADLYLRDPEALMQNFELFIAAQDDISGIGDERLEDCRIDPSQLLYLEADRGFMFAAQGYMGFTGSGALSTLLSADRNTGWGPWHESGHQRQLDPFTWSQGSGMTEVTVNLYSMAAQEMFDGRAGRLDEVYPATRAYLQNPHRNYHTLANVFHKLAMLWQLRLTFGKSFYPQAHQLYRLMPDQPQNDDDKVQRFIVETSLLTGLDLTPFFDRWGLYATPRTLIGLGHLPVLSEPLWETDATHSFPLPLPRPDYIPLLAYLTANTRMVAFSANAFQLSIASEWLTPYRFEISVNEQTVAAVDDGVGENCTVFADYIEVPVTLTGQDKIDIFVVLGSHRHALLTSSRFHYLFNIQLASLFTDRARTQLDPDITQADLDLLFAELQQWIVDPALFDLFHRAQGLLLVTTFRTVSITENSVTVTLAGEAYKNHDYQIGTRTRGFAELIKGVPLFSSLIAGVWRWIGVYDTTSEVMVRVIMNAGHEYILFSGTVAQDLIARPIAALFTDDSMTALLPHVVQATLDPLWITVRGNFSLAPRNRARLLEKLGMAQCLLLLPTIERVEEASNGLSVYFSNDDFKNFIYFLRMNGAYVSEVNKGQNYYSSLNDRHWRTTVNIGSEDRCRIDVMFEGERYPLYQSPETTRVAESAEDTDKAMTLCGADVWLLS